MNPIESLQEKLSKRFPEASVSLESPATDTGTWFLDVNLNDQILVVEWNPQVGFGVSANHEFSYGERADEVFSDLDSAWKRSRALLLSRQSTKSPVLLKEIRQDLNISQVELAKRLQINQAAISKLEGRTDLKISTLRQAVEAMGGTLTLIAEFSHGSSRIKIGE